MATAIKIEKLAQVCKVSPATISRVFTGTAQVSSKTRLKILSVAKKLNYAPVHSPHKDSVAIVVDYMRELDMGSFFTSRVVLNLLQQLYAAGYQPTLFEAGDPQLIEPNFCVAAIFVCYFPESIAYEKKVAKHQPVIVINNENLPYAHSVSSDHAQGIREAMHEFISNGHRRICFLNPGRDNWGNKMRIQGYLEALAAAGIPYDESLVCHGRNGIDFDGEELTRVLNAGADAILCAHEQWALDINHWLYHLGKRIPQDVSVITAEITGVSEKLYPPFTTISQNLSALAQTAIELVGALAHSASDINGVRRIRIDSTLIRRDSVANLNASR